MKKIFFAAIVIFSLTMCSKENGEFNAEKDSIEFGMVSLRCLDNCIQMYKLENGKLYKQSKPIRFLEDLSYSKTNTDQYDQEKIIKLLNTIPTPILESAENFGCPGCVDEPFILLKFTSEGNDRSIKVDIKEYDLSDEVKPWVKEFLDLMDEMR
jgi:hypothetical protein